jgi:methionyl-tRNA formyltransferase
LAQIAPEALLEALRMLVKGRAPRIQQDNALVTCASKLTREDGKIDWSAPAEVIERKIRAFNPWPGAFALVTEKSDRTLRLKLFDARIVEGKGRPGEIMRADNQGFVVGTGKNALSLAHVQLEGKWRMRASDFVRGHARLLGHKLK